MREGFEPIGSKSFPLGAGLRCVTYKFCDARPGKPRKMVVMARPSRPERSDLVFVSLLKGNGVIFFRGAERHKML